MPDAIKWNDAMLTGVAEIDAQHRILVDTLIEASVKLTGDTSDTLFEQITRDLLAYAIYHFDTEEQLMREFSYPAEQAARHISEHRGFSEQVVGLRSRARSDESGTRDALLAFLNSWLINHILTSDQQLGNFIRAATPVAYHHG
jgi:hemerythrin-like metal-binding protein